MELLGWILLVAGIVAVLTAVVARGASRRRVATAPVEAPPLETGLIQTLPASVPPPEARPGMFGILDDGTVNAHELMLTLLDLATRGLLVIGLVTDPGAKPGRIIDWTLRRTPLPAQGLRHYEATLLEGAFPPGGDGGARTLSNLAMGNWSLLDRVIVQLRSVAKEVGWTTAPRRRSAWGALGGIIVLAGLAGIAVSLLRAIGLSVPWNGIAGGALLVVAGILFVGLAHQRFGRTPVGIKAKHQVDRYRNWLATVEAHQIRLEEAGGVLTDNLAAALAFKSDQHLAEVLDQLVRRAAGWEREVVLTPAWLDQPEVVGTGGIPPSRIVALGGQFVSDGEQICERAGVGLAADDMVAGAKVRHLLPKA